MRQRMELTSTNRPFGLTLDAVHDVHSNPRFRATIEVTTADAAHKVFYSSSTFFLVAIAEGPHPIPSRTRSLSLPASMVLQGRPCGRVERRQIYGPLGNEGAVFIGSVEGWQAGGLLAPASDLTRQAAAGPVAIGQRLPRGWPRDGPDAATVTVRVLQVAASSALTSGATVGHRPRRRASSPRDRPRCLL